MKTHYSTLRSLRLQREIFPRKGAKNAKIFIYQHIIRTLLENPAHSRKTGQTKQIFAEKIFVDKKAV